ncbi:MAG: hypothetical protein R6U17_01565 [Thermoplasmata archaeon]
MADMKELVEKYVDAFEKFDDDAQKKKEMVNCMLKDELLDFAQECGVEVESRWTKDEIAEKLIKPEIYDRFIGSEEEEPEEKVEVEVKTEEKGSPSFNLFPTPTQFSSSREAWESLSRSIEKNLERFTDGSVKHWETLEAEWASRADEFQNEIERIGGEGIPVEDYKEISVLWRNFFNKMTARFFKVSKVVRDRSEELTNIVEKYDEDARDIFSRGEFSMEHMGDLYSLWMDMTREIRDEVDRAGNDIASDYSNLTETWERFSEKTANALNELRERQGKQSDVLYKNWNRIFEDVNEEIYTGIKESRRWYEEIWNTIGDQNSTLMEAVLDGFKEMESNYVKLLRNSLDFIQSRYYRPLGMTGQPGTPTKEMENIRKRIEELEKKL